MQFKNSTVNDYDAVKLNVSDIERLPSCAVWLVTKNGLMWRLAGLMCLHCGWTTLHSSSQNYSHRTVR